MNPAKTQDLRFLRDYFQAKLGQPMRQRLEAPLRIGAEAQRAHDIVGVPTQQDLTPTAGSDHMLKPEVRTTNQRVSDIPVGSGAPPGSQCLWMLCMPLI